MSLLSATLKLAHGKPVLRARLVPVLRKYAASYPGNLGIMEMFKFYKIATPAQVAKMEHLIRTHQDEEAWEFLQQVTGVKLHPMSSRPKP